MRVIVHFCQPLCESVHHFAKVFTCPLRGVVLLAKAFKVDLKKIEAEELAKIPAPPAAMPGKKPGK